MIQHIFESPITIPLTVQGFNAEKVEAQGDGSWYIRAKVLTISEPKPGVVTRPIVQEVTVQRVDVAQQLGLDTEVEGWEETYAQTSIGALQQAVIQATVAKVLAS